MGRFMNSLEYLKRMRPFMIDKNIIISKLIWLSIYGKDLVMNKLSLIIDL
jgi:hypothetical protein